VAATVLGAIANFFKLNPVKALVWSAVINGVVAVPVMTLLLMMSSKARIMGKFTISISWKILGWAATGLMASATLAFGLSTALG
jgi:Mn2+/Fe2+ NRAMP family transporter